MHAALKEDGYTVKFQGGPSHGTVVTKSTTPRTLLSGTNGAYIRHEVDVDTRTAIYKWKGL